MVHPLVRLKLLVIGQTLKFPKLITIFKKEKQILPEIIAGELTLDKTDKWSN